jgi:endonuclease/exonuclease/phosphatase family metal-dependent hydrolase
MLSTVLLLSACKGEPTTPTEGTPEPFTVASFNAGLATGFVPGADSRLPAIADALAAVDADVVCLQEVWTPEQVAAIEAAVGDAFPHRHFPAPSQSADATCAAGDLDALLTCLTDNCDTTCVDDVPDCAFAACGVSFLLLPKDCMRCAMANVGNDPAAVADLCVSAPVEYAYDGSFGTGILSKKPLADVEEHVFASTSNRRGVTHATIDAGVPVDVYCTHLTAVFDTIPYPRDEGGWMVEQLEQVDELLSFMDETGGDHRVLIGDLNTGPALPDAGIVAEALESYQALQDGGLSSPYVELDGRCTFCASNPILAAVGETDDVLIDHVLTTGMTASAATRILDGEISADSCSVDLSTSALSDHYGIQVTLVAE